MRVWVRLLSKIPVLDFTYLFKIAILASYLTSGMKVLLCTILLTLASLILHRQARKYLPLQTINLDVVNVKNCS